jgi:hypothetical protein
MVCRRQGFGVTPPPRLWVNVVLVWIAFVAAFSVAMIASRAVTGGLFNWVVFGKTATPSTFSSEAVDYQRLIFGITAAVMIGWSVLLWFVARGPLASGEPWAWRATTASIATWFVIDSTFSIATGYWQNAVLNTVFVAGVVPGLILTRPTR